MFPLAPQWSFYLKMEIAKQAKTPTTDEKCIFTLNPFHDYTNHESL